MDIGTYVKTYGRGPEPSPQEFINGWTDAAKRSEWIGGENRHAIMVSTASPIAAVIFRSNLGSCGSVALVEDSGKYWLPVVREMLDDITAYLASKINYHGKLYSFVHRTECNYPHPDGCSSWRKTGFAKQDL